MNKTTWTVRIAGLMLAVLAAVTAPTVVAAAGGPPENREAGGALRTYDVSNPLDADEQAILTEFLIDEHKALATYESIMAEFGAIAPFTSIARAEEQHIAALERIFERYGVALPTIPTFEIPTFASPEAAAAAGAQAEIDNAGLYDDLLSGIDNADVVRVATNLRDASLNHHLPAFEAFADGTYEAGEGVQRMAGPAGYGAMGRGRMAGAGTLSTQLGVRDGSCLDN
jgi:hypothetical protein